MNASDDADLPERFCQIIDVGRHGVSIYVHLT